MTRPRVAIVADLREESWHSMDLVADMLLVHLCSSGSPVVEPTQLCPRMIRRVSRLPWADRAGFADIADRVLNRVWDYPRWLARRAREFDVFHVVDHSYANLVLSLPVGRTVVSCHDLDAFRGVLPGVSGGSVTDRVLGRNLLHGLRVAAWVVCGTKAIQSDVVSLAGVPADRTSVVPYGLNPLCRNEPDPAVDREAGDVLGPVTPNTVVILHVGSNVARKRIDVLLDVVASLRAHGRDVRLVRVGAAFAAPQARQIRELGLEGWVSVFPFVERRLLAALYRRSTLVLQPSEREGFGLPVAEAMASGTPVVASRVPALLEVGGEAVTYCPVGDVAAWTAAVETLLDERTRDPERWQQRRAAGVSHARRFSWHEHASQMTDIYLDVLSRSADVAHETAGARL